MERMISESLAATKIRQERTEGMIGYSPKKEKQGYHSHNISLSIIRISTREHEEDLSSPLSYQILKSPSLDHCPLLLLTSSVPYMFCYNIDTSCDACLLAFLINTSSFFRQLTTPLNTRIFLLELKASNHGAAIFASWWTEHGVMFS